MKLITAVMIAKGVYNHNIDIIMTIMYINLYSTQDHFNCAL